MNLYNSLEQFATSHPFIIWFIFLILSPFVSPALSRIKNGINKTLSFLLLHSSIFGSKIIDGLYWSAAWNSQVEFSIRRQNSGYAFVILMFMISVFVLVVSIEQNTVMQKSIWKIELVATMDTDFRQSEKGKELLHVLETSFNSSSFDLSDFAQYTSLGFLLLVLAMMTIITYNDFPMEIVYIFRHNLIMIAPYINQIDKDKFIAEFVCIKCRKDYLDLFARMQLIWVRNNVSLLVTRFQ